jgi:tRNA-2-methylthio-N6-dimethylallyladenosine synthase
MKKAHIYTFGCQMNEHDSQRMAAILQKIGYGFSDDPKKSDLILINTCSVRENPENKVYSLLGRLSRIKRRNPDLIIGVAGCVAQQEGKRILKRVKEVDLVIGTDNIFNLPEALEQVKSGNRALMINWMPKEKNTQNFIPDDELKSGTVDGCKAYIAISKGCDNHCSYCIVPRTRGKLVSRQKLNILEEASDLIQKGAKEIQILGQNVNSYRTEDATFFDLLKSIADLKGLERLRFTSPHPNDWNNQLSDLMAGHPVICSHIHLPFQAGSDRILKLMRRGHTAEGYLDKIEYLRKVIPDVMITTDIIVGFPGETEEEFQETLEIIKRVRFSQIYAFVYSTRPGTRAESLDDDITREMKEERLQRLLVLQDSIQSDLLDSMVGKTMQVLIDSAHPRERGVMNGRTSGSLPVAIDNPSLNIGDLLELEIVGRKRHSLIGGLINQQT